MDGWIEPTKEQFRTMSIVRAQFVETTAVLVDKLPDGPDKEYVMRKLRECLMWANFCIACNPDGSPRQE